MLPLLEPLAPCPGCASGSARPLHVIRNLRPLVQAPFLAIVGCPECGLVYTSPRPTADELARFYDPDADDGWERGEGVDDPEHQAKMEKAYATKRERARRIMAYAAQHAAVPDRADRQALDFGCGAGAFLDVLQDEGWQTSGLEPHRLRDVAARRHRIVDAIPAEETFDLIVLHHVLEHLLDPAATLGALARAARPGAVLVCATPDLGGLAWHRDLHYAINSVHINAFTTDSAAHVLRRAGWTLLHGTTASVLGQASKDATRMLAVARRATPSDPQPPPAPLARAEDALRAYGRLLDLDGKAKRA